jgi:hypothetical protein
MVIRVNTVTCVDTVDVLGHHDSNVYVYGVHGVGGSNPLAPTN